MKSNLAGLLGITATHARRSVYYWFDAGCVQNVYRNAREMPKMLISLFVFAQSGGNALTVVESVFEKRGSWLRRRSAAGLRGRMAKLDLLYRA